MRKAKMAKKYQIYSAHDDDASLAEVLEDVATVKGHVRIVSVIWRPRRSGTDGFEFDPGYTIIAEVEG
jgi:hypothetical protein